MKKRTLRQRLIFHTVVIIMVVSTLFASGTLLLKQRLEEATFGRMVREHLHILLTAPNAADVLVSPLFDEWLFFHGEKVNTLPTKIRERTPGTYHSVKFNERFYNLQIESTETGRVYLMYDITEWEKQEHALILSVVYGIFFVLFIAIILATRVANKILSPVKRLTARLAAMGPAQRNVKLSDDFKDSDIEQIAQAFDLYSARIDNFVERERSFTAAASHELRTPLSVMLGAIDILDDDELPNSSQRALQRIRRACGEMQAFIEAALLIAREESAISYNEQTVNFSEIFKELSEESMMVLDSEKVKLTMLIESQPYIYIPKSIAKITIANLLRNALEHTSQGEISVHLNKQEMVISDTGKGIEQQHLPHVFDRSYTTKPGGTGLGLNLVKRICDRFGWQLIITSIVGNGTTVTIRFVNS